MRNEGNQNQHSTEENDGQQHLVDEVDVLHADGAHSRHLPEKPQADDNRLPDRRAVRQTQPGETRKQVQHHAQRNQVDEQHQRSRSEKGQGQRNGIEEAGEPFVLTPPQPRRLVRCHHVHTVRHIVSLNAANPGGAEDERACHYEQADGGERHISEQLRNARGIRQRQRAPGDFASRNDRQGQDGGGDAQQWRGVRQRVVGTFRFGSFDPPKHAGFKVGRSNLIRPQGSAEVAFGHQFALGVGVQRHVNAFPSSDAGGSLSSIRNSARRAW